MNLKYFKCVRTNDFSLILELHKKLFPADSPIKSEDNRLFWLLKYKNEVAGFCVAKKMQYGIMFLERSGVLREYRGHNLQIRLIRVRERYARNNNFKKIITYTKMYNITSSRNLQKAGYFLYIPEELYADKDCIYWIKSLEKKGMKCKNG